MSPTLLFAKLLTSLEIAGVCGSTCSPGMMISTKDRFKVFPWEIAVGLGIQLVSCIWVQSRCTQRDAYINTDFWGERGRREL